MASIWTEDPKSLAKELADDEDMTASTLSHEEAVQATASKIWTKTPIADWASSTQRKCSFGDLSLKILTPENLCFDAHTRHHVSHCIDRITDWEGELDEETLVRLMQQGAFADLPEVIRPKKAINAPFLLNLCILPKGGAKFDIYKHFMFERNKVKLGDAPQMCRGQPYLIDLKGNKASGAKPFIYMFQRLGGLQISFSRVLLKQQAKHLCALQTQQLQVKKEQNDRFFEMNRTLAKESPILVESPRSGSKRKTRSSSTSSCSSH